MASFTINFNANAIGDHYIGYRTYNDPTNTYTVVTHNVATLGAQAVEIQVPGNLYCGDITYNGYVIAACQPQTDNNSDGIPDAAITWVANLLKQTDPCIFAEIKCDNSPIAYLSINNAGINYVIGDPLVFTETIVGSELVVAEGTVGAVNGSGGITSINMTNFGSYQAIPNITVNSGTGAGAVLTPTMAECPLLDIRNYDCNGDNADPDDPIYELKLGETLGLCADLPSLAGLISRFSYTDDTQCHCRECQRYQVENTSGGDLKATIQTCWDGSHPSGLEIVTMTYNIPAGQTVDLGCAMKDTLQLEDASNMVVTATACS